MFELGGVCYCPVPAVQQREAHTSPKAWIFTYQTPQIVLTGFTLI